MEARVVGGRVALVLALLWAGFACASPSPSSASSSPESEETAEDVPTTVSPTTVTVTPAPAPASAPSEHAPNRLVLVTLDGVRWEDVFGTGNAGEPTPDLMPNLQRLVRDQGVALGAAGCDYDMRASGPNFVSLPGYLEMFTGKPTACTHNFCSPVATSTVIDEARAAAHREGDVAVFASWNKYAYAVAHDRQRIVLSAGASAISLKAARDDAKLKFLLEVGQVNTGYPGHADYRPDLYTARIALRYLETMTPRVLVVGLGDADEQGHRGDIPNYKRAIRKSDEFIGDLEATLGRMGEDGKRTAIIVTTDHGRARTLRSHGASFPESQRVFVAAFGSGIAHRGVTCAKAPLRLSHLAGAMRSVLDLDGPSDPSNALSSEIFERDDETNSKGALAVSANAIH